LTYLVYTLRVTGMKKLLSLQRHIYLRYSPLF